MSGLPASRKLWITPLSPVHMGTSEDYTPTDYVIEDNALYEFDQRALENLPAMERESLNRILDGKATPEMLKSVQGFFHHNREKLIPDAINIVRVSDELTKLYKNRIGKAANIESSGKQIQNNLEIERAAYNPQTRRLFFPGSGLKGAIRTALLDTINQGKRASRGERNRELQERLLNYTMRDLHKDPMRLVQIGDCAWQGHEELNSAEILFAVNRKKHPVMKNDREVLSQAETGNLCQLLECASPFRFRVFQGLLNISDVSGLKNDSDKLPQLKFAFADIARACNAFYRPVLARENQLLKNRGFLDSHWQQTVEELLSDPHIQQRIENNQAFLLRVGRHSGAESVTLNGVRSIKIMQGKGQKSRWENEARTLWSAATDQQDRRYLRPFGWLLVEMTRVDETAPAWEQAETVMQQHLQQSREWLVQVNSYRASLHAKLCDTREQEKQRVEEAVRERAEQAHRQAEEAQRLAQMTPLEREVEDICKQDRNNPAATLFNKLESGQWPKTEDQQIVADKIRTLWEAEKKWTPNFSGKNKQKVKQKDRCVKLLTYLKHD